MSDYGSPPQGPYGQSPQNAPSAQRPSAPSSSFPSSGDSAQTGAIVAYVGAGLGVLAFIWGFLSWFKDGSTGVSGYSVSGAGASAVIGLSLAAGLIAAGAAFEKKAATITPTALALAAFLVSIGIIIGKSSIGPNATVGAGIGLILAIITTILQTAALGYGWLLESGRMSAPAKSASPGQPPWGGPSSGGPYGAPSQSGGQQSSGQQGGGQQGSGPQGGYGGYPQGGSYPGGGQYQPPSAPPSYQSPGSYGPPQGAPQQPQTPPSGSPYGPPPGGYGAPGQAPQRPGSPPSQSGSTSSMPAQGGNPYQPPPTSSSDESGSGYGEATRHIPRYPAGEPPEQGNS